MPRRKEPLESDEYYHLLNRSVAETTIFKSESDYSRGTDLINYYRFLKPPASFSTLKKLSSANQKEIIKNLEEAGEELVEIICYCLMPSHFHLLAKQILDGGITIFLGNFQNSYAKYFNTKYQRHGSVFQNPFKAVLVKGDNQLLHLSRYIHLNPYSSSLVKEKKNIKDYPWSSFPEFLNIVKGFSKSRIVLDQFKTINHYRDFVYDRADYQRSLEEIRNSNPGG